MVLVTGAAGHLGAALVRDLLDRGEKVRVFVLPEEDISSLNGMPLEVMKGNVLDRESLRPALEGVDVVYHLARRRRRGICRAARRTSRGSRGRRACAAWCT